MLEQLIKEYNLGLSCKVIAKDIGVCPEVVSNKLKQLGYTINNGGGRNKKIICQLDLDDNLIAIYKSATEAAEALGSSSKNLHIGEVCQGKRKTGGGYK